MDERARCTQCGAERSADAPQGLCPACLLKVGLQGAQTAGRSGSAQPDSGFVPPTPDELAVHFPDLEILQFIGRGGMGMVYKARQKGLDRLVALKILLPGIARDQAFAERFAREARAMAMLNHSNIVLVYNFGQTSGRPGQEGSGAGAEGPLYYFVMEYVDGLTLSEVLRSGKLSPQEALAIVPQICEALQYAHDNGVVHRDIKPANILVDKRGRVKIADFGLAKLLGQAPQDISLTSTGQVMGTPHYMAPEQVEHPEEVDHRVDIYALGVVFYQMLTGELPIGRFAPPSKKVSIDVRLDEVVLRALEKEPALRYQQASEIKTTVESIVTTPAPDASVGQEEPRSRSSRSSWLLWAPLQSPKEREICAHMTDGERLDAVLPGLLYGLWVFVTFGVPVGLVVSPGFLGLSRGLAVVCAAPVLLLHIACIPVWQRMQRKLLCSTAWAKQQGITPERLAEPSRGTASITRHLGILVIAILVLFCVATGVWLWVVGQPSPLAEMRPAPIEPPHAVPLSPLPVGPRRATDARGSAPPADFGFELQSTKRVWAANEMPEFTATVRYTGGGRMGQVLPATVSKSAVGCLMEFDESLWMLRQSASGTQGTMNLMPGDPLTYMFRFQRDADGLGVHLRQVKDNAPVDSFRLEAFDPETETIHMARRFTLAPGTHKLRMGTRLLQMAGGSPPPIWSNSVTIEIGSEPKVPLLEFRIVPNAAGLRKPAYPEFPGSSNGFATVAVKELAEKGPAQAQTPGSEFAWVELAAKVVVPDALTGEHKGKKYVLLCNQAPYSLRSAAEGPDAWGVTEVSAGKQKGGSQLLCITLDHRGAQLLDGLTKANLQNRLAVIFDGRVQGAPLLVSPIGSQFVISLSPDVVASAVKAFQAVVSKTPRTNKD